MKMLESKGPDFSVSAPVSTGTQTIVPGKPGLAPVVLCIRIEKGSATSVEVNFKDPSGLILDTTNETNPQISDFFMKGEHGASIEAVVVGGSGRVICTGYYVATR